MKPRDYCCCAIPIINAGIYITLTEQFVVALLVGILSVATPFIVGAAVPSYSAWILAAVCFIAAAIQVLGFIGVAKEKAILYRRYVSLHLLATFAAFAVAAAWAITSATRHSVAKSKCLTSFFPVDSSQGDTLCEIFPWVDVGIMGGLWVVLAILHIYLYVILSSYGASQRRDHEKYDQLNNESIPMNSRSDPWDSRPSAEVVSPHGGHGYNHVRQESSASVSDMLSQPQLQPKDSFSTSDYSYQHGSYPPQSQYIERSTSRSTHPAPKPEYNNYYAGRSP